MTTSAAHVSTRVVLHIGLPKTGTTYLQSLLWAHRDQLRSQGVLLPGRGPREHLWASGVVREEPRLERRHPDAPGAWSRLCTELSDWSGAGLVSHEFLCGASSDQVARLVADLRGAEVHVVVTAREIVSLVSARWQEWVKNGASGPLDDYPPSDDYNPADEWGWGTMDLAGVLDRWGAHVPPEQIHLICPPAAGEPGEELWGRFATVLGVDPASVDPSAGERNESLGLVAVELMRRVNPLVRDVNRPVDRGVWLRGYLGQHILARRDRERFWPGPARVAELRARGESGLDRIAGRGYDVLGDLQTLRTPAELEARRHPDEVTDAELLSAASATIADLLADVRARPAADTDSKAPAARRLSRIRQKLRPDRPSRPS
jgi:hypothetical protein